MDLYPLKITNPQYHPIEHRSIRIIAWLLNVRE
jgi:hypothetical protein